MIQVIILSGGLVVLLLILNSFLNSVCGLDSSGNHGKVLEGTLTITILYLVIITLFGNQLMPDGIPLLISLMTTQVLLLCLELVPQFSF